MQPAHLPTTLLILLALACSDPGDAPAGEDARGGPVDAEGRPLEQHAGLNPVGARPRPVRGSAGAEVRVVGVMVNGETREELGGEPQPAFLGANARTRVALEVFLPAGGIIDMDREASVLELFRDDRGTDLAGSNPIGGPFEMMPRLSDDGRSLVAVVASDALPAPGASRVELRGSLALVTANVQKTHVSEPVELAPGATLSAGPWSFEVTETGQAEWSESWSFTLETGQDLTPIVTWNLVDSRGAGHAAEPWMSMSFNSTTRQSLQCDEPTGPVRLELVVWDDARRVQAPFQAQVGLGLR